MRRPVAQTFAVAAVAAVRKKNQTEKNDNPTHTHTDTRVHMQNSGISDKAREGEKTGDGEPIGNEGDFFCSTNKPNTHKVYCNDDESD